MTDQADLVAAARADPVRGFGAIYRRYGDRVHDYCLAVLRHREDAADAAQDTFLIAYQRLGQLRDPGRLRPWLYAIARSRCLRRIAERGRQRPTEDLEPLSPAEPAGTGEVESAQLRQLVWEAAAGLAVDDRAVLDLHLRQGLNGAELAGALGVPAEKANLMLHRMKQRMGRTIGALLVARTGRRDCPDLAAITTGRLTPLIRKRLARHVERCRTCRDRRDRLTPELLYASVPLAPAPLVVGERLTELTAAGTTTDLAGGLRWRADGFPRPPTVHQPLPVPQRLAAGAGVAALVVLGLLGGTVVGSALAGGGPPPAERVGAASVAPGSTPTPGRRPAAPETSVATAPTPGRPAPPGGAPTVTTSPVQPVPAPTVRITSPDGVETIYDSTLALTLDSEATDPVGDGLVYTWSLTYPYHPILGTGATTEVISPTPLRPSGARWRPADTLDTEAWCGLDGRPIRLNLEVRDTHGETGLDHVVLATYPCPIVD